MARTRLRSLCRREPPPLCPPFRSKIGQFLRNVRVGIGTLLAVPVPILPACGGRALLHFFRDLGDDARKSLPDDARWVYID